MKSKKKFIGLICVIIGSLLAVSIFAFQVYSLSKTINVVVANDTIYVGEKISEDKLSTISMHRENLPEGYKTKIEDVVDQYATVEVIKGDIILSGKISSTATYGDAQFLNIPNGKQAISFTAKEKSMSVSNKLQTGDMIRVYQYDKDEAEKVLAYDELKYLQVVSVTSSEGVDVDNVDNQAEKAAYQTITVFVNDEQAKILTEIENESGAYVTLLSRGDDEKAEKMLKAQDELLK